MSYIKITSEPNSIPFYFSKVWKNRSLISTFAWRDLKVKYAQTIIGLGWTVIQPLTALIVYTLFFDYIMDIKTEGGPYVLFVFSGLSCWLLFSYIFLQGSSSLIQNQELIRKLSFPKMLLPLSKIIVALVEFSVSFLLLLIVLLVAGKIPDWRFLLIIFPIAGTVLIGLSIALFLSAATVRYRDLQYLVPFFVNFGIWFTPVFYPVTLVPSKYAMLIYINPVAGFIDIFRWCLGIQQTFHSYYLVSVFVTLMLLIASIIYFIRTEDIIVDKI
jgi:lipopolysaccharide transport system permease protein